MIQMRYTARFDQKLDDLTNFIEDFPKFVTEEADKIVQDVKIGQDEFEALTDEPPRSEKKIQWYSANQRKAAFAHMRAADRLIDNTYYERSNDVFNGWEVLRPVANENGFLMIISNRTGYSRYVVGSMSKNPGHNGFRNQQPFHLERGWPIAFEAVNAYAKVVIDELIVRIGDRIESFSTRSNSRGTQAPTTYTHGKDPDVEE